MTMNMRPLREGEVMGAYMDFDRTADKSWSSAEYLTKFGQFISQRTVEVNKQREVERKAFDTLPDDYEAPW
jgi:hypothetical protein